VTEEQRRERNAFKLLECWHPFASRVKAIIVDLERANWRPRIQEAWRSTQAQRDRRGAGNSRLLYGYHNITAADGTPEALAVDLLDDDDPLRPSRLYLIDLARYARDHDCETGIAWGLPSNLARAVELAVADRHQSDLHEQALYAALKLGWDPAHVQVARCPLDAVRRGYRPFLPV
jgi:hypothetical protein